MNYYSEEEIKAAKATRDKLINGYFPEGFKSIYMAGEICMWDELQKEKQTLSLPSDEEIEREFATHGHYDDLANERQLGRQEGAKWLKSQLLKTE